MANPAVIILVVGVLYAFIVFAFVYSVDGDVAITTQHISEYDCLKDKFQTKDKVVKRLLDLHIYKTHPVLWPMTFVASFISSYLLLYALNSACWRNMILAIPIFFVTTDLTRRVHHSHRLAGVDLEAMQLYSLYKAHKK